jgi:hypothetical protein
VARWVRPRLESFPSRNGYLRADPGRIEQWRKRLASLGPGLKVGFSWTSSNLAGERRHACTRLAEWGELFAVPAVHWICLQYGDCDAELSEARDRWGLPMYRFEDVDYFEGLDDVAALMGALDLVISAPTTVSVQAAALGVEVWQLSHGPYWQRHGTAGNPWLPTLVLFDRQWGEGWSALLGTVAQRLREHSTAGTGDRPA